MRNRTEFGKVSRDSTRTRGLLTTFAMILVAAFSVGLCFAKTAPEFERMKSLVGEWKGSSVDGKTATITYTLVSDNSALIEKLVMGGESEMVTIYHPDGDHLMMTHYCSAHNQPRMRSKTVAAESKSIILDLVDVTNLSGPDAGHMKRLVVTFGDKDHFSQEWTWTQKGKESPVVIHFERKK